MDWTDLGLVIGARPFGESAVILELMTRNHGRHLGLVHGGRSRTLRPLLQPGNLLHAVWRARLDEQLGSYTIESERLHAAALLGSPMALAGLGAMTRHLRSLPERDPHPGLFEAAAALVVSLSDRDSAPAAFVRFELQLLTELGFGLDLSCCAATGTDEDLVFVSPRTGRAVSREAGEPYRTKLLPLPAFLLGPDHQKPEPKEVTAGLRLTGHFLLGYLYGPKGQELPDDRERFAAQVAATDGQPVSDTFPA